MALKTDFNVAPYFDDYDEFKDYYRILFRPGTAVQARELTQLQTIIQKQIERFGSWSFSSGDIVYGCQIFDMPLVPYVRLMDFGSNGSANTATLDVRDYVNAVATSYRSGLKAQVVYANAGFSTNYPDTNILYLKYINTGDGGESIFSNNELLTFEQVDPILGNTALSNVYSWANTSANTVTTGNAHGISVTEGVVFIGGEFVRVANSTFGLVNNFGTYAGNNVVGFDLIEEIVTENQDESLLDNALGYSNENAPGAHRLKLSPYIVSLTQEEASLREKFNPIGTYNYGTLVSKTQPSANLYSIVGEVVSKRTYEESGNYVVNPFIVDTITTTPGGDVSAEDANGVLGRISSGVGYAQGNRVELLKTSYINLRRGVDTQTNRSQEINFNYGNYFIVNEFSGTFLSSQAQTVKLYDTPQYSVTNRTYATTSPAGNLIGTARMRCMTYNSGSPGTSTAQYLIHIFDISMSSGYAPGQIKSLYFDNTNKGFADVIGGVVGTANKKQLYSFGVTGVKNLRDQNNNINTDYYYRTSNTSATMLTTGEIVVRLACSQPGGTDILPFVGGTTLIDSETQDIIITTKADVDSNALTGTVNVTSTATIVKGNGTTFTSDFTIGDIVKVDGAKRIVTSIANNIYMTVDGNFAYTNNTTSYRKNYANGKIIPSSKGPTGPNTYVTIDDSTTFTVHSGQVPSTSVAVDVSYIVKRTVTTPAKKTIKKNRFVKINTSTNPKGPWCLGFGDVHKLNKIYGTSNGVYTTAGVDLTSSFMIDTGQKDTHYGLAYLYAKTGYSSASYPNILIDLDFFAVDTTTGLGFFTVESYPIDDVDTSNTNAIQTKDITLYIDENNTKLPLRDHVDFRTPCINTANDCGTYNAANGTQVNTAISYATLNPSSTLTLSIPSTGINFPAYGKSFEADYTFYLGRKDLIMITPENIIKVKEGVSALKPQTPLFPENAMPLSVLNIPPYPSLSSDQIDEFLTINQSSTTLIRDANLSISGISVTNRRYTMKDIGAIDQRVSNLEYYTQLSLLEKKAKDLSITDENGLDRFKNGIFVDAFSNKALCDTSNQEFSIAIDSDKGYGRPKIVREIINIGFSTTASSNVVKTGRLVTLSYTETPFLTQPYATKYRSSALVAAGWHGLMTLIPSYDNNVNQKDTGSADIYLDMAAPWKDFAASPLAYSWGDWRTTVNTEVNTAMSGAVHNIVRNWDGTLISDTVVNPAPVSSSSVSSRTTTLQDLLAGGLGLSGIGGGGGFNWWSQLFRGS